jgi:hypothetical protein
VVQTTGLTVVDDVVVTVVVDGGRQENPWTQRLLDGLNPDPTGHVKIEEYKLPATEVHL